MILIQSKKAPRESQTIVELTGSLANIRLYVRSKMNARQRRAIAVAFFRQIEPFLKYFSSASVDSGDGTTDFYRARARGLHLFESADIANPLGKLGYEIRTLRLERGLSQVELANRVALSPRQISRIERGVARPHLHTLKILENALQAPLPPRPPASPGTKVQNVRSAQGVALYDRELRNEYGMKPKRRPT